MPNQEPDPLGLLSLAKPGEIESCLEQAVSASQPPLGQLFPYYARDADNAQGGENDDLLYEDGELLSWPQGMSPAQVEAARAVAHFIPGSGQILLPQKQLAKILHEFRARTAGGGMGSAYVPMTCAGPYCPLVRDDRAVATGGKQRDLEHCRCPLYESKINPLGRPCPLELLQDSSLRQALYAALEVDERHTIHAHLIGNLVAWLVVQSRILAELGMDPFMIVEQEAQAVAIPGSNGQPASVRVLKKKDLNPLIIALDICQKHIDALRKQLVATPEAKARLEPRDQNYDVELLSSKTMQRAKLLETTTLSLDKLGEGGAS